MSLITGPYYQGDPDQKVEQYGDFDYVQYSLFSNLENIFGIDHSSCVTAFPMWENAGGWAYDYSMGSKILLGAGSYFQKGYLYSGLSNSSLTKNWSEVAPIAGEDFTICIPYIKTYPSGGTYRKIFSAILGDTGVDIFINQWSASIAFQVKVSWNATTLVGTNSAKEYSCCCVREGGENLILYENGEAVATGVKAGSLAKSITPTIGNYEGLLKGLMYFKKAISADQAHALSEYPSRLWQPAPQKTYFIPSGSPLLPINLTGSAEAVADAAGQASKAITVAGTAGAIAEATGVVSKIVFIQGAADVTLDASSILSIKKALSGSAAGLAASAGIVSVAKALSGSAGAISDAQGQITLQGIIRLSGSADAVADAYGATSVIKQLSGLANAIADAQGQITILEEHKIYLSGSANAITDAQGGISITRGLTGTIEAIADASGEISAKLNMSGSVDAIADAIGNIRVLGDSTLGVVIDPTIASVTVERILEIITKKYTIESI